MPAPEPIPTAFRGYLLKGNVTNTQFPLKFIAWDTWETQPNQREEIKAYRDENTRNLTRITASGMKSKFKFKTRDNLHLQDIIEIEGWFAANESNHIERKISVNYWDDEQHTYKDLTCYRSNPKYKIKRVTDTDIIYGQVEYIFVEY